MATAKKKASRRGKKTRRASTPRGVARKQTSRAGNLNVYIRSVDTPLTLADREYLRHKLNARLARFGARVERVSVRIDDLNGPRGGIDKSCSIKVVLSKLPSVTVEERHSVLRAAIDGALARVATAVSRRVGRVHTRTTAPRHKPARSRAATDEE